MHVRRTILGALLTAMLLAIVPGQASASSTCSIGGSGVSYSAGQAAVFKQLRAYRNMNCPSARYVLNKWLRPTYQRSGRLPLSFFDGYVTWRCRKLTSSRWQCNEYDSGTAFRFTAYRV